MLATLVAAPFDKPGWVKAGDHPRLLSRNGKDRTVRFPGIAAAITRRDGEVDRLEQDAGAVSQTSNQRSRGLSRRETPGIRGTGGKGSVQSVRGRAHNPMA